MSNLTGQSGVNIFIFLRRRHKMLKTNNRFVTQVASV